MMVWRGTGDESSIPPVSLREVPGDDVRSMQIRHLHRLPSPWRLRIAFGDTAVDVTSAPVRGCWSPSELFWVLAAVSMGRASAAKVHKAAASRAKAEGSTRWSWATITGGNDKGEADVIGMDPENMDGTIGEALDRCRGRLIGAWSGKESGITDAQHIEARRIRDEEEGKKGRRRNVRHVRAGTRKP
jgi:hypothetical protein